MELNFEYLGKTTQKTRVSEIIPINSDIALEATTATPEAMGLAQNTPTTGLVNIC